MSTLKSVLFLGFGALFLLVSCAHGPAYTPLCEKATADVTFLLAPTWLLGADGFKEMIAFVRDVLSGFKLGGNHVRVNVVTYIYEIRVEIRSSETQTFESVSSELSKIQYEEGSGETFEALEFLEKNIHKNSFGARSYVPKIVVYITDTLYVIQENAIVELKKLQISKVTIFAVGVGEEIDMKSLHMIAAKPENSIYAKSFKALDQERKFLTNRICKVDQCTSNPCLNGKVCKTKDTSHLCVCPPGKDCSEKPPCTCSVSGDPHYRTFDGQMIHFMGICKYTLVTNKNKKGHKNPFFAVEVKNEHRGNSRVSYTRMVDVKFDNVSVRLLPKHKILVNSEIMSPPINNRKHFIANYSSGWVNVYTEWGLHVKFDGIHRVIVTIHGTSGGFTGICGDCNGKKDDLKTKEGQDVSNKRDKFSIIGNSHKVNDDSDKPHVKCFVKDVNSNCSSLATERCNVIRNQEIFGSCIKKLGETIVSEYYEACKIDACSYHKDKKRVHLVVCEAFEGFAEECEKAGITVDWRRKAGCVITCDRNEEYKPQTPVCQPSCFNPTPTCKENTESCVCKPGFVLSGTNCVKKEQCGCFVFDRYLPANETFFDERCSKKVLCRGNGRSVIYKLPPCGHNSQCKIDKGIRKCICNKGFTFVNGKCKKIEKPPCTCSVSGDPHYRTFDGQMIHFMGICKYTLVTNKNKKERENPFFAVEVKNEHRGNSRVSYTRMVDVKFDNFTVRLLPKHKILVNSEIMSLPINDYKQFIANYSSGWVNVYTEWGLHVKFDGIHRVIVTIHGTSGGFTGICGDCNGKKDDLKTKEGQDVSNKRDKFAIIGNSHKLNDDSDKPHVKCFVKDVNSSCSATVTKRCNVIRNEEIFGSCIKKLGETIVSEYYEACKIDACSYHKDKKQVHLVVCEAFEGFAEECEKVGINVDWRRKAGCDLNCEHNEEYKFHTLTCQPSCVNPHPKCEGYTEACVCKPGYVLSGTECVKKEQCGCSYKGRYLQINETFYNNQCSKKVTCASNNNIFQKEFPPCGPNSQCAVEKGIRQCACNKGFVLVNGKCSRKDMRPCVCKGHGDPHYQLFDGQRIDFAGICKYLMAKPKSESNLTDFKVEVKNEHRKNYQRVSFTRLIEVKFKDFNVKLMNQRKVMINNKQMKTPILEYPSFKITEKSGWLELDTGFGLHVMFNGNADFVITLSPIYRKHVTGICGNCNGVKDDYRTKEGIDVSSKPDKYAMVVNSYQVLDDSVSPDHICNKQGVAA